MYLLYIVNKLHISIIDLKYKGEVQQNAKVKNRLFFFLSVSNSGEIQCLDLKVK